MEAATAVRAATAVQRGRDGMENVDPQDSWEKWSSSFYENDDDGLEDDEWWQVPMDGGQGKNMAAANALQTNSQIEKPTEAPSEGAQRNSHRGQPTEAPSGKMQRNSHIGTPTEAPSEGAPRNSHMVAPTEAPSEGELRNSHMVAPTEAPSEGEPRNGHMVAPTEAPSEGEPRNSHMVAPTEAPSEQTPEEKPPEATNKCNVKSSDSTCHQWHTRVPVNPISEKGAIPRANRVPHFQAPNSESNPATSSVSSHEWPGLKHPVLSTGARIDGDNKRLHRRENKHRRIAKQVAQEETSYWTWHRGQFTIPPQKPGLNTWRNNMCPSQLALHHPAAETLLQYATGGCPTITGRNWTKQQ